MDTLKYVLILLPLFWVCETGYAQQTRIDLETLLQQMTDRETLARYPDPEYTTRQFSSYDRNATEPGDSTWFANWDRSQFIRVEQNNGRKEYVMMDTDGPGAIVRFWMTFAGKGGGEGTLRIYFDHEKEPTIEGRAFDVISGGLLAGKPLSTSVSPKTGYETRGHNLYLPLPYHEHCKVTYQSENIKDIGAKSGGESVYYNINYRSYGEDVKMETFSKARLAEADSLLGEVQRRLRERDKEEAMESIETDSKTFSGSLSPGDSLTLDFQGPAAIRKLGLSLNAANEKQALRSTIIGISFDGERTVWAPVGDFFGTGYQYRPSDTWYTTVTEQGDLSAYWVMPFEQSAKVTLKHIGRQEVELQGEVVTSAWEWDERSMHFGASWHQYTDLQTGEQKTMKGGGGPFDITYNHLKGKGMYVGDALTLFNTVYAWWGEGDEKIFIDGEDFPSHFGTGTEDYYGYAWVRPEVFTNHPFISQPDGSGNITPGYTVNIRHRALDAIPFREELRFEMEMWHWAKALIDYAPTTFYYLRPGGKSEIEPDVEDAKEPVTLKREDIIPPRIKDGRLEMEHTIIGSRTGGNLNFQHLDDPSLSNGKQLWWHGARVGDSLQVSFRSQQAASFAATARFVTASDYGQVRIAFNGRTIADSLDLYSDSLSARTVELGRLQLKEGKNTFIITFLDKAPDTGHALFGWDYIDFKP